MVKLAKRYLRVLFTCLVPAKADRTNVYNPEKNVHGKELFKSVFSFRNVISKCEILLLLVLIIHGKHTHTHTHTHTFLYTLQKHRRNNELFNSKHRAQEENSN